MESPPPSATPPPLSKKVTVESVLRSCLPGADPISGREKYSVWPPPENRKEHSRTMGKMAQKWVRIGFGAIFPIFQLFFAYFPGEAKTYILPISGRRPEMGSVPGKQDHKISPYERRQKLLPKLMPISTFQACVSFLRCIKTPGAPKTKILVYTGMLPCLVP